MYRGTTPSIVFNVNTTLDLRNIKVLWVTLKNGNTELTLGLDDVVISAGQRTITVNLSQEQTLSFKGNTCEAQLRFTDKSGKAYASNIVPIEIKRILKEGVIGE